MPAAMEESITALMQNLSLNEEVLPTLLKIKAYITTSSSSSLKNVVLASHVACLYNCLDTVNKEQIEIVCYILNSLFPILDPVAAVNKLSQAIQTCLKHSNSDVKLLGLSQLNQILTTVQGTNAIGESPEILTVAVSLIGDGDLAVASAAVSFLSNCARLSPSIAHSLLDQSSDSNLNYLKSVMASSDEVRYRVFELICHIQVESQELLDLCTQSGIVDELLNDLSGNDVLLKVSACSMLAEMASTQHGLDYLEQRGVVACMVELLKNAPLEPLSNLYVPGVVKFFGSLCASASPKRVFDMYPGYFDLLFDMLNSADANAQRIAVETIGIVGHSSDGKTVIGQQGAKSTAAVKRISNILLTGQQDIRLHAVNTMCQLLDLSLVPEEDFDDVIPLTILWFQLISDDPIGSVVDLCKLPFPAIRCAAFHLLKTIASCDWGLEAMVELPFLAEYLLDRSTESNKECKEAKHEVVATLCASKRCANIFGNRNYLKFRQFVKEGPFYVETQLNVAFEEGS